MSLDIASQVLLTLTPHQKKKASLTDIQGIAASVTGGEVYTRITNSNSPTRVCLVAFPDDSCLSFRENEKTDNIFHVVNKSIRLEEAISAAQRTFVSSHNPAHKYRNRDEVDVVVSGSSPKSAKPQSRKQGGSFRKNRRHRRRSIKYRRSRLSRNRK